MYSVRQLEARQAKLKKEEQQCRQQEQQRALPAVVPIQSYIKPLQVGNPIAVTASIFKFQDRSCDKPQLAVPAVPRITIANKENVEKVDNDNHIIKVCVRSFLLLQIFKFVFFPRRFLSIYGEYQCTMNTLFKNNET